ncbi:hypothetical protein FRX31_032840 [Thalictrum thalictroides]|uniref:Uncharacterized protein n=1 Tax=Thalictrum thalictroides TaxID=46969 RepID=A0A7J6UY66_THATH|nr:hypothetical protein FRX31_032840 [Thalictrum thalictroides]
MTVVGASNETKNQKEMLLNKDSEFSMDCGENTKKRNEISMKLSAKLKGFAEFDNNSESCGSSSAEEFDSPKSVWKSDAWKEVEGRFIILHHQVLKIRHEDLHLGEDIGEGFNTKEKLVSNQLKSNLEAFFREENKNKSSVHSEFIFSKPFLHASPLGGKTAS